MHNPRLSRHLLQILVAACIVLGLGPYAQAKPRVSSADPAYIQELVLRANTRRLYDAKTWHRLLHYHPTLFGVESEADGRAFFLAPAGKTDPQAELEATLKSLFSDFKPPKEQPKLQHPYCRFPARLAWLNKQLHFDFARLPQQHCPEFDEYMRRLAPDAITLVFSSYYLNNPASAFGHTFLRINKKRTKPGKRQELLDTGIDFSATVDTPNAIIYAFKGLFGMFPGVYRKLPYYYKVREYNDYESRDLWEYELNLTPQQVQFVVAHIWELGSTYFDYYYTTENCSYHILGTLEVADPNIELLSRLGWPVLPADTIRAIWNQQGLVRNVYYRPSNRTQFKKRLSGLGKVELDALAKLMNDASASLDGLSVTEQRRVLDTALDLADVRFAKEVIRGGDTPEHRYKQRLLERRAKLRVISPPLVFSTLPRDLPHSGHRSARVGMGEGYSSSQGLFYATDFRLALHDLLDLDASYPLTFQLEFMTGRARYYLESKSLQLEDFYPVRIRSYTPITRFLTTLSWRVGFGATRLRDHSCYQCMTAVAEVGGGGAWEPTQGLTLWLTTDTRLYGLAPIQNGLANLPLRFTVGPNVGARLRFSEHLIAVVEGQWNYLPVQRPTTLWRAEQGVRYNYHTNFALSAFARQMPGTYEAWAMSHLYF